MSQIISLFLSFILLWSAVPSDNLLPPSTDVENLPVSSIETLPAPDPPVATESPADVTINQADSNTIVNISGFNEAERNQLIEVEKSLPASWIEDFNTNPDGWELIFCDHIDYDGERPAGTKEIVGLTKRVENQILITVIDIPTVAHEITHYIAARIGWREPFLRSYYRDEAEATAQILGPYSQVNADEYFAEFVACWLAYPSKRAELTTAAPRTAEICQNLQTQFPELLADYQITKKQKASIY